jgi:pSer/pThr/pTyr-binding forkhead associated (FHA) protein
MRIGRRRGQSGEPTPEIDLTGVPQDPGISRLHAVLERRPDGGYAIRDLGSTNGTTLNDDPVPLGQETAVQLADGDRIRLGAWTTITVRNR